MKSKMVSLFAVLMVALMLVGVSYAMWSKTLYISGSVTTGTVNAEFAEAASNDDGTSLDPSEIGTWTYPLSWSGARYDKHVGTTTVSGAGSDTLTITVSNAYPSYYPGVGFTIHNIGSIPVKIQSITTTVTPPDGGSATDLTVTITGIAVGDQIDAEGSKQGDIHIHVEQAALQGKTYTVSVEISLVQWNEFA